MISLKKIVEYVFELRLKNHKFRHFERIVDFDLRKLDTFLNLHNQPWTVLHVFKSALSPRDTRTAPCSCSLCYVYARSRLYYVYATYMLARVYATYMLRTCSLAFTKCPCWRFVLPSFSLAFTQWLC